MNLLRLFARCHAEYDFYDSLKQDCGVKILPLYFNTNLARLFFATNPFA